MTIAGTLGLRRAAVYRMLAEPNVESGSSVVGRNYQRWAFPWSRSFGTRDRELPNRLRLCMFVRLGHLMAGSPGT